MWVSFLNFMQTWFLWLTSAWTWLNTKWSINLPFKVNDSRIFTMPYSPLQFIFGTGLTLLIGCCLAKLFVKWW